MKCFAVGIERWGGEFRVGGAGEGGAKWRGRDGGGSREEGEGKGARRKQWLFRGWC